MEMTLSDYFKLNRYQPKYQIGDRVEGKFNKIPFIGSIGTDSVRFDGEEPHVTITLDLPLKHNNVIHNVIRVPTKSVKARK
jgi:hypothetical protein